MKQGLLRILTAIAALPIVLYITYVGGSAFVILISVICVLAQYELYDLLNKSGYMTLRWVGLLLGIIVAAHVLIPFWIPIVLLAGIGLIISLPFLKSEQPFQVVALTAFGVIYPVSMLSLLTDIRSMQHPLVDDLTGFRFTLLVLAMVWLTDTFAYYVGKSVGRHPLMPRVSPKKTWEGFIGGCLGAIVAVISLKIWMLPMLSWLDVLVLSFIGGVISPLGDLAESRIKRSMQVKDSGGLLPGHGGVLDRFDAMLVTAPLVYLYLTHVVLP